MRWVGEQLGQPDWAVVIDQLSPLVDAQVLTQGLKTFAPRLESVLKHGVEMGISPELMQPIRASLTGQLKALEAVK